MTKRTLALLRDLDKALTNWIRTYAPEQCASKSVMDTQFYLLYHAGGTLYYIAKLKQRIKAELKGNKK